MTQMLAAISFLCWENPFQREPCYAKRNGTVECRLWMLGPGFQFQRQLLPAGWARGLRVFICETRRRSSHKIVKKRKWGRAYHHAWPRAGPRKMVVIMSFREKCLRRLIRSYTLPLWPWIVLPPGMVVQDRPWEAGCRPRHWAVLKRRKQAVKADAAQILELLLSTRNHDGSTSAYSGEWRVLPCRKYSREEIWTQQQE